MRATNHKSCDDAPWWSRADEAPLQAFATTFRFGWAISQWQIGSQPHSRSITQRCQNTLRYTVHAELQHDGQNWEMCRRSLQTRFGALGDGYTLVRAALQNRKVARQSPPATYSVTINFPRMYLFNHENGDAPSYLWRRWDAAYVHIVLPRLFVLIAVA